MVFTNLSATLTPFPAASGPAARRNVFIALHNRIFVEALDWITREVFPDAQVRLGYTAGDVLAGLAAAPVDYLIVGLNFPDMDGHDLLREISERRLATHVLVAAGRYDDALLPALHTARIDAIVDTVTESISDMKQALRTVESGQVYVSQTLRALLVERHPSLLLRQELTAAELRVLRVIGQGNDNQEAADVLGITEATVQTHRRNIMRKLKVSTSAKLVREAMRLGVVKLDSARSPGPAAGARPPIAPAPGT